MCVCCMFNDESALNAIACNALFDTEINNQKHIPRRGALFAIWLDLQIHSIKYFDIHIYVSLRHAGDSVFKFLLLTSLLALVPFTNIRL